MQATRKKLISFLKKLGLIYREGETDDQINQRVLNDGARAQKSFLSKELVEYLAVNGIEPPDDFRRLQKWRKQKKFM